MVTMMPLQILLKQLDIPFYESIQSYGKISGIVSSICTFRRTFKECFFVLSHWPLIWLLRRGINDYIVIFTF